MNEQMNEGDITYFSSITNPNHKEGDTCVCVCYVCECVYLFPLDSSFWNTEILKCFPEENMIFVYV